MYVDTLDNINIEAILLYVVCHLANLVRLPYLTGLLVVQCPYDSLDTGNLAYLLQGYGIIALTVPAESHVHNVMPPFCVYHVIVQQCVLSGLIIRFCNHCCNLL